MVQYTFYILKHQWAQLFRPFLRKLRTQTKKSMPTSIQAVVLKQFLFYELFSAHCVLYLLEKIGYQNNEKHFKINVFYSSIILSFFLAPLYLLPLLLLVLSYNTSYSFLSSSFLRSTSFSSSFF